MLLDIELRCSGVVNIRLIAASGQLQNMSQINEGRLCARREE